MLAVGWISSVLLTLLPASAEQDRAPYRIERKTNSEGVFLLAVPVCYSAGDMPALVVCLHGTDTSADEMLAFWLMMKSPYPMVFAAPQSSGTGWRDTDAARIVAAVESVRRGMSVDWSRVLLTGHSAGGAMTFYMVYERDFPATAAATTANYLPPTVTAEQICKHRELPVYYAVGMRDVNQECMRAGITLLRSGGASVTVHQPAIGHVLDREVTQKAMDFFIERNRQRIHQIVRESLDHFTSGRTAMAVAPLQPILDQRKYHSSDEVAEVETTMCRIEGPARDEWTKAESFISAGQFQAATGILLRLERDYAGGRLARRAAERRRSVLADHPEASPIVVQPGSESQARRMLEAAIELTRQRKFGQAREKCRILLINYEGTRSAAGARRLLEQLDLAAAR